MPTSQKCPECFGSGWVGYRDRNGAPMSRKCDDCQKPAGRSTVLELAGVPELMRLDVRKGAGQPFDKFKVNGGAGWPRDERMRHYDLSLWAGRESDPGIVTLAGTNGRGKSMLAAELLYRAHQQGQKPIRWVTAAQLCNAAMDRDAGAFVQAAQRAGALVIDELGRGHQGEFFWSWLTGLIRDRMNAFRPTVLTTNMSVQPADGLMSLAEVDEALTDTLMDGAICVMAGPSMRGVAA